MEDLREQPIVRIKAEQGERFLPNDFYDVLAHRYFPVLSLTYIAAILGMAICLAGRDAGFVYYFFEDPYVYRMGYWVAAWVSIPSIVWILVRSTFHVGRAANLWYQVTAGLMILTVMFSFLLLETADLGINLRLFMVASTPIMVVQYYFFVKGGLPARAAWPLTVAGLTFLIYGLIL